MSFDLPEYTPGNKLVKDVIAALANIIEVSKQAMKIRFHELKFELNMCILCPKHLQVSEHFLIWRLFLWLNKSNEVYFALFAEEENLSMSQ